MSRAALARLISIVGHPALVVPGAVLLAVSGDAPPRVVRPALLSALFVAAAVMAYSLRQVRTGRWSHLDASVREERRQLNLFLAVLLTAVAGVLWLRAEAVAIVAGVASAALLAAVAHASRQWLKISLYVAFATFGAAFLWPSVAGVAAMIVFAAVVAWSRLVLKRHSTMEVAVGGLLGLGVGALFLAVL